MSSVSLKGAMGNYYLAHVEGRQFPGLLIQGDSLKEIEGLVVSLVDSDGSDVEEHKFLMQEVLETIKGLTESYELMMNKAGLKLPYAK